MRQVHSSWEPKTFQTHKNYSRRLRLQQSKKGPADQEKAKIILHSSQNLWEAECERLKKELAVESINWQRRRFSPSRQATLLHLPPKLLNPQTFSENIEKLLTGNLLEMNYWRLRFPSVLAHLCSHSLSNVWDMHTYILPMFATFFGTFIPLPTTGLSIRPLEFANLFETREGDVSVSMVLMICSNIASTSFVILELLFSNARKMPLIMDQ